jgi:hypothetical protein
MNLRKIASLTSLLCHRQMRRADLKLIGKNDGNVLFLNRRIQRRTPPPNPLPETERGSQRKRKRRKQVPAGGVLHTEGLFPLREGSLARMITMGT